MKFKHVSVKPPSPPINPDLKRQTETGSDTAKKVGGWLIKGNVIRSGSLVLDATMPSIYMLSSDEKIQVFLGEDGT